MNQLTKRAAKLNTNTTSTTLIIFFFVIQFISSLNMLLSRRHIIAIVSVFFVLIPLYLIIDQWKFENWRKTLFITFDDLGKKYSKALKEADLEHGQQPVINYPVKQAPHYIPPKIHFIWFKNLYGDHLDVSTIPTEGSNTPDLCREKSPDLEVKVWNATEARDLLETHYSWFIPQYDAYKYPIQRVDAFKYFLLYHHGGIYIDLDISCRRSLAPLLEYPAWFPQASPLGVNNDLMAAGPKHPIVGRMINMLASRDRNLLFPYLTIFFSTGPKFTSDVLKSWWDKATNLYEPGTDKKGPENADSFFILPQDFYSDRYTFFGHRPGGTWHGKDVAVILWLVEKPYPGMALIGITVSGIMFFLYRRRR